MDSKDLELVENCNLSLSLLGLFDNIKGAIFFLKEPDGRLITGNALFAKHCGLSSVQDINGSRDKDIFPKELAEQYHKDDLEVVGSQKPKLNIIELFPNYLGDLEWYVTNKIPIFNSQNNLVAICGLCQLYPYSNYSSREFHEISPSLKYLKKHYCSPITNQELAKISGLTVRQFSKRFQKVFHTTPHQYILKLRVLKACDLLLTKGYSIGSIAIELGFYDQSSFTGHFKKIMGETPLQYIKKHEKPIFS